MKKINKVQQGRTAGRSWTQWKEPEARAALASWRQSGLSAAKFCAREGYSVKRLQYWQRRLGEVATSGAESMSFVPMELSGLRREMSQIEIERGGVVVRVREDLDVSHVARLVAALAAAERPC